MEDGYRCNLKSQEVWDRSYFCKKSYSTKTNGGGKFLPPPQRGIGLNKNIEKPVPAHFVNSRDHSIHDMIFTPFEKLYKKDKTLLDVREKFWIVEKKTFSNGLNKML